VGERRIEGINFVVVELENSNGKGNDGFWEGGKMGELRGDGLKLALRNLP